MVRSWHIYAVACIWVMLGTGCASQATDPVEAIAGVIDPRSLGVPYDGALIGLLTYRYDQRYTEYTGPVRKAEAQACFADKDSLRNVGMVSVNSQTLDLVGPGRYRHASPSIPGGTAPVLRWLAIGLQGSSYSYTFEMGRPINVIDFDFLDTMSIVGGATLRYAGSYGTGDLSITITPNQVLTARYVHPDSASTGSMMLLSAADRGFVTFTPEQLAGLRPHRVYDVKFEHGYYQTTVFQKGVVGHYTTASTTISFLLRP